MVLPPLCRISRASIVKPATCSRPGEMAWKLQRPRSCPGEIGKCGGDIARLSTCSAPCAVLLVRQQDSGLSVVMVPAAEERQALDVVPVQVSEQDGPGKRLAVQQPGDPADSRSGVENDRRRRIIMGDGDTGGVTAVADEVRARRGRRPADTAKVQPHGLSVATLLSLIDSGQTSVDS
jgi:hypothetical protein